MSKFLGALARSFSSNETNVQILPAGSDIILDSMLFQLPHVDGGGAGGNLAFTINSGPGIIIPLWFNFSTGDHRGLLNEVILSFNGLECPPGAGVTLYTFFYDTVRFARVNVALWGNSTATVPPVVISDLVL